MSAEHLTITLGEHEVELLCSYTPGEPAQLLGPPERCHEGSPEELEVESAHLLVSVTDDLSPSPRAQRTVRVNINELVTKLSGWDAIQDLAWEAIRRIQSEQPDSPDQPD